MSALNDVNIEAVAGLAGKIQQEPEVAGTKWNASVSWKGGFRSEAQVRDFEPMSSDEPGALGGTDTGPNPVEQVLAALGNCLAVGYAANATAMGIEIRDLSIDLEGDLDLHTFLGLAPQGNAGYDNISVKHFTGRTHAQPRGAGQDRPGLAGPLAVKHEGARLHAFARPGVGRRICQVNRGVDAAGLPAFID
jgi:hypothetical protein